MQGFSKGDTMSLINGERIVIDQKIDSGGTADIYRVLNVDKRCFQCGKHLYFKYSADPKKYYDKLKILSQTASPHPAFVWSWPNAVTKFDHVNNSFFFVMELLDSSYKNVIPIIKDPDLLTLRQRIDLCLILADAAKAIEDTDLVFGDWSSKNVMWKENQDKSISIRIIDCDGMSLPGYPLGLGGTGKYRSPEVLAGAVQTAQSDIHSLAVLTFRLLCRTHPLDGKRTRSEMETEDNLIKYYSKEPIFIFDGFENEADMMTKKRFSALPRILQLYYKQMFSNSCLHGREDRPNAGMLKAVLLKAKQELM